MDRSRRARRSITGSITGPITGELAELVDRTPADRERLVDLLRAVAIVMVVVGHWLVIAVTEAGSGAGGEIDGVNALRELEWLHPFTWLFQVMPVFFLVGGYVNAASWRSHRERGGDVTAWVVGRHERLVLPAAPLLGVLVLAVVLVGPLGVDHEIAATGAWLATVPLWFLLAYMAIVTVAPATVMLHDRVGLWAPIVLALVAAGVDVLRFGADLAVVGDVNYVVVWLCIHQLGYAWGDGRLGDRSRTGRVLFVGGLAALVALTRWGPYPVSMVTAPGQEEQNTEPPTIAILALAVAQLGLALALRCRLRSWLQRRRPWTVVVAANTVVLTVFLWHMAVAIPAALLLHGTGLVPTPEIGSSAWYLLRLPWLLTCALLLAVVVLVASPVERWAAKRSGSGGSSAGAVAGGLAWVAVVAVLAGLLGIALAGPGAHGPLGLPTAAVVAFAVGVALLGVVGRIRSSGQRASQAGRRRS